jgi:hypothetical protein
MNFNKSEKLREDYRSKISYTIIGTNPSDEAALAAILACADIMAAMSIIIFATQNQGQEICKAALEQSMKTAKKVRKSRKRISPDRR